MKRRRASDRPFVFIDSSAYFAAIDATDHNHQAAVAISERLRATRWRTFTSTYIVTETHALLLARVNWYLALQFLDQMEPCVLTPVRPAVDPRCVIT